jgi:sugar (pentulose or hexulose) kinase
MLFGIDVGTSSSKGVLVERDGTIVALTTVEHKVSNQGLSFNAIGRAIGRDPKTVKAALRSKRR